MRTPRRRVSISAGSCFSAPRRSAPRKSCCTRRARASKGLANSSGEVGHNLMDHISKAGARGIVPGLEDKYVYGRRPTGTYIPRFRNLGSAGEAKVGFVRGYGIRAGASREGWARGADEPGLGVELK